MLYESYENRIKQVAKAKNLIVRFRILIITVLAVIAGLTTTYVASKGAVPGGISGPKEIYYGDVFEFSANALMSDIHFEYSKDGSIWQLEQPRIPGKYYVRTITDTVFGDGSGNVTEITILPRPVDVLVVEDEIEYGGIPNITAELIGLLDFSGIESASN